MRRVKKVDWPCGDESCDICYKDAPIVRKPRAKKVPQVSFDMLMGRAVKVTEMTTVYSPDDTIAHYEYVGDFVVPGERSK